MLPAYERDAYITTLDSRVLRLGEERGRPFVILEDTVFYPEGGGQPCDLGTVNGVALVDVQKVEGEIRHFLAAPLPVGPAALVLDWDRRMDHMQQHTGQHLLTAVAEDCFGWATTAFHLGPSLCDIELETPAISAEDQVRLETAVAAEIRARHLIRARWVSPEEYRQAAVRSRGLPAGHQGDIRLVEIEGVDRNTCGGTHLQDTGEIESLKLLDTESIRGGTRLLFVAGGRVRRRLGAHERRTARMRTLLGAPEDELVSALMARLDLLQILERRQRKLEEALAEAMVPALASRPEEVVEAHLEGRDMAFLQRLARGVLTADPAKAVFLTGDSGGQGIFLLSAGGASGLDVVARGKAVAVALGAKGGGAGRTFQGKASSLQGRAMALAALRKV